MYILHGVSKRQWVMLFYSDIRLWRNLFLLLLPGSAHEAGAGSHLLRPHALRLWSGKWGWAGWGPVDGAWARASSAAPERLPEERHGAREGQEATRGAAIARKEGGSSLPASHPRGSCHPLLFLLRCPFVVLQHRNLTPLIHEDRLCDTEMN